MAVAVEAITGLGEQDAGQNTLQNKEGILISFPPTQDQIYANGRTNVSYSGPFEARNDTLRQGESFDTFFYGIAITEQDKEAHKNPLIADETNCCNGEIFFVRERKPGSAA